MPFNNKRNSRDDNSRKSRSNSESFRSKNGRPQRSSSTSEFRKSRSEEEDNKKSSPFSKFEKKNWKDDSSRSFNKFDKLVKKDRERPFQKDEKGGYSGPKKFDKTGKKPFNRFDDEKKAFKPSYPRKKIATAEPKDDGLIRLNRYISNAGICSRRKADELIESGVVSVNGEVVTALGTKVDPAKDEIKYNGERLKREKMVYVLLNKPKDFITTTDDPQERKTVMQLVAKATKERIYPV